MEMSGRELRDQFAQFYERQVGSPYTTVPELDALAAALEALDDILAGRIRPSLAEEWFSTLPPRSEHESIQRASGD